MVVSGSETFEITLDRGGSPCDAGLGNLSCRRRTDQFRRVASAHLSFFLDLEELHQILKLRGLTTHLLGGRSKLF